METREPETREAYLMRSVAVMEAWKRLERERPRDVVIANHMEMSEYFKRESPAFWFDNDDTQRYLEYLGISPAHFARVVARLRAAGVMATDTYRIIRPYSLSGLPPEPEAEPDVRPSAEQRAAEAEQRAAEAEQRAAEAEQRATEAERQVRELLSRLENLSRADGFVSGHTIRRQPQANWRRRFLR